MNEERRGYKEHCDDDEEECIAVKGCRKGRPVKVRLEEDCDPIPVKLEKGCDPIPVRLEQEHCDPIEVSIRQKHCDPIKVTLPKDVCVGVRNCEEGVPLLVAFAEPPPPPAGNSNQFVFDGTSWVPELTPSKFVPIVNVEIDGAGTIWTPTPGTRFRLMGFQVTSALAGQLNFRDGVGGPVIYSIVVVAGVPTNSPPMGNGILSMAVGNPLTLNFEGGPGPSSFVSGLVQGQEVA